MKKETRLKQELDKLVDEIAARYSEELDDPKWEIYTGTAIINGNIGTIVFDYPKYIDGDREYTRIIEEQQDILIRQLDYIQDKVDERGIDGLDFYFVDDTAMKV
jgi:benzoyl-CoA reductase/2-hydroxyglutaryl-CoA dehydratase subunit BcrC/BadD/HgdB